jgi:hypothetical protein
MRVSFKDPALQEELQASGFVRVRLFAPAEVSSLLEELMPEGSDASTRPSAIRGLRLTYHSTSLDEDAEYRSRVFRAVKHALEPALEGLLADYRMVSGGLIVKTPGTGTLALHSDPTMTRERDVAALTVWCPLINTDEANGGLRVVPGSHNVTWQINGPGLREYYFPYRDAIYRYSKPLSVSAGEAIIFDNRLIHGSPPNGSDRLRPVVMATGVPEETKPVFYLPDPHSGGTRFLVFDHSEARYLKYSPEEFFAGRITDELIGSVANPNHPIEFAEFERRLRSQRAGSAQAAGGFAALLRELKGSVGKRFPRRPPV